MRTLSKSRLIAFRQCTKKLWLSIHQPKQQVVSAAMQANFDTGNRVGDLARKLYDPEENGYLIDPKGEGYDAAMPEAVNC